MFLLLSVLVFQFAFGNEINRTHTELDRIDSLKTVVSEVESDRSYQELLDKIEELDLKVEKINSTYDPKKNVMKTIGYTSSVVGLISSVWGVYEKSLSLKNSVTELEIRMKTQQVLSAEKAALLATERSVEAEALLLKKTQLLGELNEKIANIKLRIRISRLGLTRGLFKGVSSIGIFTLTLFIDDIMAYIYRWFPPKTVASNFLRGWNRVVYEASIYQTDHLTPAEKSLFWFADAETLGIPESDFLDALAEYKQDNPTGYKQLRQTAERELKRILIDQVVQETEWLDMNIRALNPMSLRFEPYVAEPDGTYVAPKALPYVK